MPEAHERNEGFSELDLGHILRVLIDRKWLIMGVSLATGVIAAAYSLTKPNMYESEAALIVREPQVAISVDENGEEQTQSSPTFSVETLQSLTESVETKWNLFESLWEQGVMEDWREVESDKEDLFRRFQNLLSTDLRQQRGRSSASSVQLLPVLYLKTRATTPEAAQRIANEWAVIVEEQSRALYTQGVEATDSFIGTMYQESNDTLLNVEQELSDTTLEARIDLKKERLETFQESIMALEESILEIEIELAVNEEAIAQGRRRVAEQEFEGQWIGTVIEDYLLREQPYPFDTENLGRQTKKIRELMERKVEQRRALRQYRREQNLLVKEQEFEHYQEEIQRILLEKAEVEDQIPGMEQSVETLAKRLESLPERNVLNKAITDDPLWNAFLEGEGAGEKATVPLKSEQMNPVYQATLQRLVELNSELAALKSTSAQLESRAREVSKQMEERELELDTINQELDRRTAALEATEGAIKLFREDYLAERDSVEELEVASLRKREEMNVRMEKRDGLESQSERLDEDMTGYKLAIDRLTRDLDKTKNVRTALASKAEAVALLKVTVENASRTGTAILYNARANPDKVGPDRKKLVLAAMLARFCWPRSSYVSPSRRAPGSDQTMQPFLTRCDVCYHADSRELS
jgi:uncharacterized protein involved in exopolysaccharide biosynthesis